MSQLFCSLLLVHLTAGAVLAQTQFPTIPLSSLDDYIVRTENEKLESMLIERLVLRGHNTIRMNVLDGHFSVPTEGASSASFRLEYGDEYGVDFFSFREATFPFSLDDDTLNKYLDGLALTYTPEQQFEIIEASAFSGTGRSKFRILGRRAHFITYKFLKDEKVQYVSEAWAKNDDRIYVVRIISPKDKHSSYIKEVRRPFSSMAEID